MKKQTTEPRPELQADASEELSRSARMRGEALRKIIASPLKAISKKAGIMEREAPLFKNTEASGQTDMFSEK